MATLIICNHFRPNGMLEHFTSEKLLASPICVFRGRWIWYDAALLFLGLFEHTKENLKNTKDFSHLPKHPKRPRISATRKTPRKFGKVDFGTGTTGRKAFFENFSAWFWTPSPTRPDTFRAGADFESILAVFDQIVRKRPKNWPKRPKFRPNLRLRRGVGRGQSGWPGFGGTLWLCSKVTTLPNPPNHWKRREQWQEILAN